MKKKSFVSVLSLAFIALLLVSTIPRQSEVEIVRSYYIENLKVFTEEASRLHDFAKAYQAKENSLESLQGQLIETRLAFKKIEFLIDYFSPENVKDFLNGAPLLKTERSIPRVVVLEPKGLQTLEEQIFVGQHELDLSKVISLTRALKSKSQHITSFQSQVNIYDRHIFEAARLGIVRVMALGVTGFDTPAGVSTMQENLVAYKSIYVCIKPYLKKTSNRLLATQIDHLFSEGIKFLQENQDFENFNRALFIRNYIEPLYGRIKDLHLDLHYETMDEVVEGETSVQYSANSIFSDDFLNPYYYSVVYKSLDSKALQDLGKVLFFDPILSVNNKRSCASCHNPGLAFADGLKTSLALNESEHINRNAPSLLNSIYTEKFFYDLRAEDMEAQIEHVLFNEHEFGTNYKQLFRKLGESEEYKAMFNEAFKGLKAEKINRYTISAAISSYLISLTSFNSKVDQYLRGDINHLDEKVIDGFNLFMGKAACGTCHFAPTFSGLVPPFYEESESEVLGILKAPNTLELDEDLGRIASGKVSDEVYFFERSFKTPTVRNTALTAPYFHNGAYNTLQEVIAFYNHGGAAGLGIDLPLQTLPSDSLNLNHAEQEALVAFITALNDTAGLTSKPKQLPSSTNPKLSRRKVGGEY